MLLPFKLGGTKGDGKSVSLGCRASVSGTSFPNIIHKNANPKNIFFNAQLHNLYTYIHNWYAKGWIRYISFIVYSDDILYVQKLHKMALP